MSDTGIGSPNQPRTKFSPNLCRSANPPRVDQSRAHRGFVEDVLPFIESGSVSARSAVLKIGECTTWNGRSRTRRGFPDRYWCKVRTCPTCGRRWAARVGRKQAKQVRQLIGSDVSKARRVTLNFDWVPQEQVPSVVEAFRSVLAKFFEKHLPDCVLIGGFDFAFDSDGLVMVHIHGTLISMSGRIRKAVRTLKKQFSGERRFWSNPLADTLKDGRDGPAAWHTYGSDFSVAAAKHNNGSEWDHHQLATPLDKLRWIALFQDLKNESGNRIRTTVCFGFRRALRRLHRLNDGDGGQTESIRVSERQRAKQ
jgi:hypothetical protein